MADSAESPAAAATAAAPGPDGGEGAAKKPTAKELRMQKKAEEVRGAFFFALAQCATARALRHSGRRAHIGWGFA
jgi:hypothetical protein